MHRFGLQEQADFALGAIPMKSRSPHVKHREHGARPRRRERVGEELIGNHDSLRVNWLTAKVQFDDIRTAVNQQSKFRSNADVD